MDFENLLRDTVSLIKSADGACIEGIKAGVQSDEITIFNSKILIEAGDLIVRTMSNGGKETFEVIDPCFNEAFYTIPANYKAKVRKLGIPEARAAVQSVTYHVNGNNARINNNSVDNSINVVSESQSEAARLIEELRNEIRRSRLPHIEETEALEIVDGVEAQFSERQPKRSIVRAMLSALPHAGSIATIVGTLVSLAG